MRQQPDLIKCNGRGKAVNLSLPVPAWGECWLILPSPRDPSLLSRRHSKPLPASSLDHGVEGQLPLSFITCPRQPQASPSPGFHFWVSRPHLGIVPTDLPLGCVCKLCPFILWGSSHPMGLGGDCLRWELLLSSLGTCEVRNGYTGLCPRFLTQGS